MGKLMKSVVYAHAIHHDEWLLCCLPPPVSLLAFARGRGVSFHNICLPPPPFFFATLFRIVTRYRSSCLSYCILHGFPCCSRFSLSPSLSLSLSLSLPSWPLRGLAPSTVALRWRHLPTSTAPRHHQHLKSTHNVMMRRDPTAPTTTTTTTVVKMVFGGKMADNRSMKKIPASDATLFKQCQKEGGFVPYYVRKMHHQTAKKALSFGFLLRLCQGSEEVPVQLKQVRASVPYCCKTTKQVPQSRSGLTPPYHMHSSHELSSHRNVEATHAGSIVPVPKTNPSYILFCQELVCCEYCVPRPGRRVSIAAVVEITTPVSPLHEPSPSALCGSTPHFSLPPSLSLSPKQLMC